MANKCPKGFIRVKGKCAKKEELLITSKDVIKPVRAYTKLYIKYGHDSPKTKKLRLDIEKIAGRGAMPRYPDSSELSCPTKLAKEVACAQNMIVTGRAKGYQANAVCRASAKRTECNYCPTLPACKPRRKRS